VRFARFNLVSGLGIGVQLLVVATLNHGFGWDATIATAAGVAAAVVHNFGWHLRWTWRDRMGAERSRRLAFAKFAGANGAVSLVGSVMLMPLLAGGVGLPVLIANLGTIAACGLLNFALAGQIFDRGDVGWGVRAARRACSPSMPLHR
jgi:putative flippase GtrA